MKHIKRKGSLTAWCQTLSLSTKIMVLVCLAGMLPLGVILMISAKEIQQQSYDQQMYALNQGFEQTSQTLEDKMMRLHSILTMLAVDDMVNLSLKLDRDDEDLPQLLASFERIDSYAYGMEMAFERSNIWFYIDEKYPVVNDSSGRYRSLSVAQETDWYRKLIANKGTPTWVKFSEDAYDDGGEYVAITRGLWDPSDYTQYVGVLAVSLEKDLLENMMIGTAEGQMIYLETEEGDLLASNVENDKVVRLDPDKRRMKDTQFREIVQDGETSMVRTQMLDQTNVYLVSILPKDTLLKATNVLNTGIGVWYFAACALVLLIFFPLTRSVTKGLTLLKSQMTLSQDGVLKKIETKGESRDEIGQLISRYNSMTDKVAALMQKQYNMGQEKSRMELKALQSQINPHFLYNTLDMINWMAQKNETQNIRTVVQAMSNFYRLTLSRGQDIVTIGDEVKMCEAYMEIQNRRYRGRILFETEVEEDILGYHIPKITLQPFLENAIVHGINEKEDTRGIVTLNGWMEDGRITLIVTDDGKGFCPGDEKKPGAGSHYGMKNIEKRLELYYGERIPVQIESSPGVGTCIMIQIPAV